MMPHWYSLQTGKRWLPEENDCKRVTAKVRKEHGLVKGVTDILHVSPYGWLKDYYITRSCEAVTRLWLGEQIEPGSDRTHPLIVQATEKRGFRVPSDVRELHRPNP